jgi:ubiquitin-conjugating enzyme E2 T
LALKSKKKKKLIPRIYSTAMLVRVRKEIEQLEREPPPGISAWPRDDDIRRLEATIRGAEGTCYECGTFRVHISLPLRYPFEPPKLRFATKIYHPNIDAGGRICLDTLVMPPKGVWTPSLNVAAVLNSVRALMASPNPDDPLMADICHLFRTDYQRFEDTARQWTQRYAVEHSENEQDGERIANEHERDEKAKEEAEPNAKRQRVD